MGKKRVDYVLLFLVLLLAMFGLFMLYSTEKAVFRYQRGASAYVSGILHGLPKFEKSGGSGLRVVTFSISDGAAGW